MHAQTMMQNRHVVQGGGAAASHARRPPVLSSAPGAPRMFSFETYACAKLRRTSCIVQPGACVRVRDTRFMVASGPFGVMAPVRRRFLAPAQVADQYSSSPPYHLPGVRL